MSETDDTDVLLLIPPKFFLVPSSGSDESLLETSRTVVHKPVSCTAQVLGKLVGQVHSLESRLECLEIDSSNTLSSASTRNTSSLPKVWDYDNFNDRSIDRKYFTFPRRRRRKHRKDSKKDISLRSIDNDLTILVPKVKTSDNQTVSRYLLNDSQSMDGDISSIVSTPSKKNDKLFLNEIDEFLTKVESYESPETKFKNEDSLCPDNVIKAAGEYISQQLDSQNIEEIQLPSGRKVSSNVLDKYIYLVKNHPEHFANNAPSNFRSESDSSCNSVPQKPEFQSPSIRRLNFSENKDVQPTSTPKRNAQTSTSYSESFRPSSNKIYDKATKVLEQYKSQNNGRNSQNTITETTDTEFKKDEFKMPQMKPFCLDKRGFKLAAMQIDSLDTELLSLSELWGEKAEANNRFDSVKLEEEKLKREHCEAMIQQLQKKILEQQEKLAVAMTVDRSKDAAIVKLREAWLKLTSSLDRAEERHKAALEKMVREMERVKCVANESQQKTSHFERELYKALDLAHDYQEKCKQFNIEKQQILEEIERTEANKENVIKLKEGEIETLKDNYETVMRLNKQSTDCVKNLEDALDKEKNDHEETISKNKELHRKIQSLCDEASLIKQERDLLKTKVNEERSRCNILERQLCDAQSQVSELQRRCDTMENDTESLHKQLDIQKTELKSHYQQQLEAAVLAKLQQFQHQLDLAQQDMDAAARAQQAAVLDACSKQAARVEEQHRLEVNVLEEKQREEIKLYRLQLAQASEKIGLLESKVDSWRRRRGLMAAQLHGVMEAQWKQALHILTRPHAAPDPTHPPTHPPKHPPTHPPAHDLLRGYNKYQDSLLDSHLDDSAPYTGARHEMPHRSLDATSDTDLQHYMKMLLMKPPNFEVNDLSPEGTIEEPTSDRDKLDRKDRGRRGQQAQHGQHTQHGQQAQHGQHTQHGQQAQHGQHTQHGQHSSSIKPPWKA